MAHFFLRNKGSVGDSEERGNEGNIRLKKDLLERERIFTNLGSGAPHKGAGYENQTVQLFKSLLHPIQKIHAFMKISLEIQDAECRAVFKKKLSVF